MRTKPAELSDFEDENQPLLTTESSVDTVHEVFVTMTESKEEGLHQAPLATIDALPKDVLSLIFDQLPPESLLSAEEVSRGWRSLAQGGGAVGAEVFGNVSFCI